MKSLYKIILGDMRLNLSLRPALCKKSFVLFAALFVFISAPTMASEIKNRALKEIEKENWGEAYNLSAQTKDPLVARVYYWRHFQEKDSDGSFDRLSYFVENHKDWPRINDIRRNLEKKINISTPADQIITWFEQYPPLTPEGLDGYAKALLSKGQTEQVKDMMGTWWATTLMSQGDQKQIYREYKSYIPLEAHRRRFDKLLFNGHYTNARAIANVLGHGYSELAEARIALAEQKNGVDQFILDVPRELQDDPGLMYERLKWRRKKGYNTQAIKILNNPPPPDKIINKKAWWRERHIMIRRLMEEGKHRDAYNLASEHFQTEGFPHAQAEWLAGWLALRFVLKPVEAYQKFEGLHARVKTPVSKARASYWAGRAAEAMKADDLRDGWYKRAAQYQTVYYGQKAGEKIGLSKALKHAAPPILTPAMRAEFSKNQLMQIAIMYHEAKLSKRSTEFLWAFVKSENTPEAYRYAAETAAKLNRYHDVIAIAKAATREGLFLTLQSYPKAGSKMKKANRNVDPALIHALIRQESQFDEDARSPAGALGLMQLMPATAKQVAREIGVAHQTSWLTQRPSYNVQLGSQYISDMLNRFDGNYPMAIASYNAGPGRVDRWIKQFGDPRTGEVSEEDWIELIPIYETRNYVQRVTEGLYVYRLILNN